MRRQRRMRTRPGRRTRPCSGGDQAPRLRNVTVRGRVNVAGPHHGAQPAPAYTECTSSCAYRAPRAYAVRRRPPRLHRRDQGQDAAADRPTAAIRHSQQRVPVRDGRWVRERCRHQCRGGVRTVVDRRGVQMLYDTDRKNPGRCALTRGRVGSAATTPSFRFATSRCRPDTGVKPKTRSRSLMIPAMRFDGRRITSVTPVGVRSG